jgi:hypothetical protein
MLNSDPETFDEDAALAYLKKKYDTKPTAHSENDSVAEAEKKKNTIRAKNDTRPRSPVHGGGNKDTSPNFSPRKYELVAVEENRPLVEVLREMGAVHYRLKEPEKGSKFLNPGAVMRNLLTCIFAVLLQPHT